jgi:hypothetical protein
MTFSKNCTLCHKEFNSLSEYMKHIREDHKDVSPTDFLKSNKEIKWKFRED